jgi:hypothetical protein
MLAGTRVALAASDLGATGYLDGTWSSAGDGFALNQASLSLAYTPGSGLGALVNAVVGTEACSGCYAPGYASGRTASTGNLDLLQAHLQYVSGRSRWFLGKFTTLAGAEVAAPTGNTNITRSLLYWYAEPLTHVGVRYTHALSDRLSLSAGVNNGWNNDRSFNAGTYEFNASFAPSSTVTLAATAYHNTAKTLIDFVATWQVTPALTAILSADWDRDDLQSTTWWGVAGYANYAINERWRVSLRGEYLADPDTVTSFARISEGTLTFGYAASQHFDLRIEGRADTHASNDGLRTSTQQLWLQALYTF